MATEDEQFLVPTETYLKSGIHIGTKFRTKYMEQFIYKTRPDGLNVLNLQKIDERIKIAAYFLSLYAPDDIIAVSRRESGWKGIKKFQEMTSIRVFAGRYPPGMLTNPALAIYSEAKIMLVSDAWPDRNAVLDALKIGIPVIALCDTNNQANNIDLVVPCNNKGKKSLGLLFYILTREYLKGRRVIKSDDEFTVTIDDFTEA
ncbi:TPA: 30S ribosomal protein S2 [Candidatus Woesearchaeota archaeon]|nr:30S ribosomal protein S2 [Candidatus Woesearchaeota archaeon]HII69450.1 30S ribosomal protein S2 [Candidatus Woesearchaeota archaeon]